MGLTITLELTPIQEQLLMDSVTSQDAERVRSILTAAIEPTVESLLKPKKSKNISVEALLADKDKPLSAEELDLLLDELAGPASVDTPPLSDYAVSREGIYEGYPEYEISG